MKRTAKRIAAEVEFVAEAQRVVDYIESQGGDSATWRREVEIRKAIIARENGN